MHTIVARYWNNKPRTICCFPPRVIRQTRGLIFHVSLLEIAMPFERQHANAAAAAVANHSLWNIVHARNLLSSAKNNAVTASRNKRRSSFLKTHAWLITVKYARDCLRFQSERRAECKLQTRRHKGTAYRAISPRTSGLLSERRVLIKRILRAHARTL
jgi:hypothetical protein